VVKKAQVDDGAGANGAPVAVAIVAEDAPIRQRLAKLLAADGLTVAARVSRPERILEGFADGREVLVVLCCDPDLAPASIRTVRRGAPEARVVLVADQTWTGRAVRSAVRAQADAVVYSDQLGEALGPSIRAVIAEQVVFPRRGRHQLEIPALTHRERQVLRLAAQGRTNDEIAGRLYLATSTVKSHLTSAFAKLAVRSRSEAVALVSDPDEPVGRAILSARAGDTQALPGS
jgi:DNA-binding NarL/FixJ family response regulator